jgi:hypothetical protein
VAVDFGQDEIVDRVLAVTAVAADQPVFDNQRIAGSRVRAKGIAAIRQFTAELLVAGMVETWS